MSNMRVEKKTCIRGKGVIIGGRWKAKKRPEKKAGG